MRYAPTPSVVVARTFSISAGLLVSTVTPGSTAPLESFTTPAIAPVCCADIATCHSTAATAAAIHARLINPPCAGQTGEMSSMKEPYGNGVATHTDPEACTPHEKEDQVLRVERSEIAPFGLCRSLRLSGSRTFALSHIDHNN